MTVSKILGKLEGAGFSVSFDEDIVLHGQKPLDDELKNLVQDNKQEILFHLRTGEYTKLTKRAEELAGYLNDHPATPLRKPEERLAEYEQLVDRISELQPYIDHYELSGLGRWYSEGWFLLHSDLLNEIIVIVRDPETKLSAGCSIYPIYQFSEVKALDGKSDDQIRAVHKTKKVFSGEVQSS